MGVSTNASISFGVDFEEDWPFPDFEDQDLGAYLAKAAGHKDPWDDVPDEIKNGYDDEAFKRWERENPEWSSGAWYELQRKLEAECPIEVHWHCSYDSPMYIVSIRGTEISASRGYPEQVKLVDPDPGQRFAARVFMETHGIEWKNPAWLLYSMWG